MTPVIAVTLTGASILISAGCLATTITLAVRYRRLIRRLGQQGADEAEQYLRSLP